MKFKVTDFVKTKYPDIIEALYQSKTINDEEKQYWLDSLNTMDDTQVFKLKDILSEELAELKKINPSYGEMTPEEEREILELKKEQRKEKEKESRLEDKEDIEDLLSELSEI